MSEAEHWAGSADGAVAADELARGQLLPSRGTRLALPQHRCGWPGFFQGEESRKAVLG